MKSKIDWVRRSQRVICMVSELHRMGYQHLRIMPYIHPLAWRLLVAPREMFSESNGAFVPTNTWGDGVAISSAGGFFDWEDCKTDNARDLAEKFVTRFPDIAKRGLGQDWPYAGWLSALIGFLEGRDLLPVSFWEDMQAEPERLSYLPIWDANGKNIEWVEMKTIPSSDAGQFPLPPTFSTTINTGGISRTVKSGGGIYERVFEALNGFKTKYGCWPNQLEIEPGCLSALITNHLTPLGFFHLQSTVEILEGGSEKILAKGQGQVFDYGEEGWKSEDGHRHDAKVWAGCVNDTEC